MIMTNLEFKPEESISCLDNKHISGWHYSLSTEKPNDLFLTNFPKQVQWSVYKGIFYELLIVGKLQDITLYFETRLTDPHGVAIW